MFHCCLDLQLWQRHLCDTGEKWTMQLLDKHKSSNAGSSSKNIIHSWRRILVLLGRGEQGDRKGHYHPAFWDSLGKKPPDTVCDPLPSFGCPDSNCSTWPLVLYTPRGPIGLVLPCNCFLINYIVPPLSNVWPTYSESKGKGLLIKWVTCNSCI